MDVVPSRPGGAPEPLSEAWAGWTSDQVKWDVHFQLGVLWKGGGDSGPASAAVELLERQLLQDKQAQRKRSEVRRRVLAEAKWQTLVELRNVWQREYGAADRWAGDRQAMVHSGLLDSLGSQPAVLLKQEFWGRWQASEEELWLEWYNERTH